MFVERNEDVNIAIQPCPKSVVSGGCGFTTIMAAGRTQKAVRGKSMGHQNLVGKKYGRCNGCSLGNLGEGWRGLWVEKV